MSELLSVMQTCNSKNPGPVNLLFIFLKNLPTIGLNLIIYNTIWTQGVFPGKWCNANVVPIPKPGKNKFNIENYRPISLINTLRKLMEKIINKRLIWTLEWTLCLTKEQCEFGRNYSTLDTLFTIHTDIFSLEFRYFIVSKTAVFSL